MNADIATVCLFSACREHNAAQATRWLLASELLARDQLAGHCQEIGDIDLGSAMQQNKALP